MELTLREAEAPRKGARALPSPRPQLRTFQLGLVPPFLSWCPASGFLLSAGAPPTAQHVPAQRLCTNCHPPPAKLLLTHSSVSCLAPISGHQTPARHTHTHTHTSLSAPLTPLTFLLQSLPAADTLHIDTLLCHLSPPLKHKLQEGRDFVVLSHCSKACLCCVLDEYRTFIMTPLS